MRWEMQYLWKVQSLRLAMLRLKNETLPVRMPAEVKRFVRTADERISMNERYKLAQVRMIAGLSAYEEGC